MKILLNCAEKHVYLYNNGLFCVRNTNTSVAIKLEPEQTVSRLREELAILPGARLRHLGIELRQGPLSAYNISPGSAIFVYN